MCLAVPARVIEVRGMDAVADLHGNRVEVNLSLVPDAVVDDWILIHAGFAIQKLDCQTAEETFAVLEDLARSVEDSDGAAEERSRP